ncbi:ER-Golgi SNARE complex subunit Sed5 [Babesia ovis]|uniref:ER-Golgi SNARE complex subunit Sed5 n=1 Tax=Babesia ovis TaxID=5869 RepID=A0A9W5TAZ7_BABOV|nr:ER-Golgi SNARE complex subunit Sed5 [Babesia ovis]
MDRSSTFKRRVTHFCRTVRHKKANETSESEHSGIDRFSILSAGVFIQLQTLHKLVEPFVVYVPVGSPKDLVGGYVHVPLHQNIAAFVHDKRRLFEKTDIKDVVHDIRVAGDLIQQMSTSIEKEIQRTKNTAVSKHLQEHRIGVIACLQHKLKNVQADVEQYERYRLKVETNTNVAMRIMTQNCLKTIKTEMRADENSMTQNIAQDYLSLFMNEPKPMRKSDTVGGHTSGTATPMQVPSQQGTSETSSLLSLKTRQMTMTAQYDFVESPMEQDVQMLEMQHKALVQRVNESAQAAEMSTIDGVQQRLSEISSMFEQFSGTLAVQLDMFECINANVMESLSNIETTETTLTKTDKQGMSFMQQMMCYSFVGSAVFLLFVDYIKSRGSSYLF